MPVRPRCTRLSLILKLSILFATLLLLLVPSSRAQTSGSTQWGRSFVENAGATPAALAIDASGNTFVTGEATVSASFCPAPESCRQALTIKYDPTGKALWEAWLSTTASTTNNTSGVQGLSIALDSSGNAYVLFNILHPRSSDSLIVPEVAVAKYNSAGGRDWINFSNSSSASGGPQATPVGFAVSPDGNVYVTYTYGVPDTAVSSAIVTKYDTAGHFIWSQTIDDDQFNAAAAIGLDANENVYVDVNLDNDTINYDGEIVEFNAAGTRLAAFGNGTLGQQAAFHVDSDGTCYFSGRGASNGTPLPDLIAAKFNPDQSLAYLVDLTKLEGIGGFEGTGSGPQGGVVQVASDSAGDTLLLQHFDQTGPAATGEVVSVLKLDPSGNEVFITRYNSQSDQSDFDRPVALAVSSTGGFYVAASAPVPAQQTGNGGEFVTIKYNSSGVRQWLAQYAGPNQNATPIALALAGDNLVVTGTANFSNGSFGWVTLDYVP